VSANDLVKNIMIEEHVTRQQLAYMISIALLAILLAAVLLFSDMVYWHLRAWSESGQGFYTRGNPSTQLEDVMRLLRRDLISRSQLIRALISFLTARKYSRCVTAKDRRQVPKMVAITYRPGPEGTAIGTSDACLTMGTPSCQEKTRKPA
jgi:hypothetical protein